MSSASTWSALQRAGDTHTGGLWVAAQPPDVLPDWVYVILVKPELLPREQVVATLDAVEELVEARGDRVLGRRLTRADLFLRLGFLAHHYPRLTRVARYGPAMLDAQASASLDRLCVETGAVKVLDAYTALRDPRFSTPAELDHACRRAGIVKLSTGSYASAIDDPQAAGPVVVLNGFVPALEQGYRDPDRYVAAVLCGGSDDIPYLRSAVLGDLDPGAAQPGTLRALGYSLRAAAGGAPLAAGTNGIHLSAGHLEALFQQELYFGPAAAELTADTGFRKRLRAAGITEQALVPLRHDPNRRVLSRERSPYELTEEVDGEAACRVVASLVTHSEEAI